jgi:hypothetical protein
MQFIFIDETGNSGFDLDNEEQPFHILFGVVIEHRTLPTIQNELLRIAKDHYESFDKSDFEFKGFDLYKGKAFNKNKKVDERIAITEKVFEIFRKYELKTITIIIDKQHLKNKYKNPMHPHQLAFRFMVEKFESYLIENQKFGLMVCDEIKEHEQSLIEDLESFKRQGTSIGSYDNIVPQNILDSVHYVKSHNSWGIQLSDVGTYFVSKYFRLLIKQNTQHEELSRSEQQIKEMVEKNLIGREIKVFP